MQLLAVCPPLVPMPASLQQGCICLVHCISPRAYRIMVFPRFPGAPRAIISQSLGWPPLCFSAKALAWVAGTSCRSSLLESQVSAGFRGCVVRVFFTAYSHFPREAKANTELLPSSPSNFPTQVISHRSSHQSP